MEGYLVARAAAFEDRNSAYILYKKILNLHSII